MQTICIDGHTGLFPGNFVHKIPSAPMSQNICRVFDIFAKMCILHNNGSPVDMSLIVEKMCMYDLLWLREFVGRHEICILFDELIYKKSACILGAQNLRDVICDIECVQKKYRDLTQHIPVEVYDFVVYSTRPILRELLLDE